MGEPHHTRRAGRVAFPRSAYGLWYPRSFNDDGSRRVDGNGLSRFGGDEPQSSVAQWRSRRCRPPLSRFSLLWSRFLDCCAGDPQQRARCGNDDADVHCGWALPGAASPRDTPSESVVERAWLAPRQFLTSAGTRRTPDRSLRHSYQRAHRNVTLASDDRCSIQWGALRSH